MTEPDLLLALAPVLDALRALGVRHFVGGSLASTAHGVPRASIDVDVVAELRPGQAARLAAALRDAYYVSEERVAEAIATHASFNVIHLQTMVKVDVFVAGDSPFDCRALDRAETASLEGGRTIPICSAEDTLLAKLAWFRRGGEVSERQWADVVGILQVGRDLDAAYLRRGAVELGVSDLLDRALADSTR